MTTTPEPAVSPAVRCNPETGAVAVRVLSSEHSSTPRWEVGDTAVWRGREVQVLAVDQVVIDSLGTALTRSADELSDVREVSR